MRYSTQLLRWSHLLLFVFASVFAYPLHFLPLFQMHHHRGSNKEDHCGCCPHGHANLHQQQPADGWNSDEVQDFDCSDCLVCQFQRQAKTCCVLFDDRVESELTGTVIPRISAPHLTSRHAWNARGPPTEASSA